MSNWGRPGGTGTLNVTAGAFEASQIRIGDSAGASGFALLDGDVTADVTVFQNAGASTAELRGGGTITGNLTVNANGLLEVGSTDDNTATGNSEVGILTASGNFTGMADGTLGIQLNGTTPGTEHDQLVVGGDVALGGMTLDLTSTGFTSMANQNITLILNNGANAVSGTFFEPCGRRGRR